MSTRLILGVSQVRSPPDPSPAVRVKGATLPASRVGPDPDSRAWQPPYLPSLVLPFRDTHRDTHTRTCTYTRTRVRVTYTHRIPQRLRVKTRSPVSGRELFSDIYPTMEVFPIPLL